MSHDCRALLLPLTGEENAKLLPFDLSVSVQRRQARNVLSTDHRTVIDFFIDRPRERRPADGPLRRIHELPVTLLSRGRPCVGPNLR